jgi:hypothetical protein
MIHTPNIAKAPIGDLDQDSFEDDVVLEMISRTLESLDRDDQEDVGYDTADSWDVQDMVRRTLDSFDSFEDVGYDTDDDDRDHNDFENKGYDTADSRDVNRRRCNTMIHSSYITKASLGDMLDQDHSEEESVQDPVRRTLDSLDVENHDRDDFKDTGYDTDGSWDVTRRRWARSKGDRSVLRRCRMRNREKVPIDLPGLPWPVVNQDDKDRQDADVVEVAPITAEQTCQRTVDYFGSKGSELSQDSPDSVLAFNRASRGQHGRKSATNRAATAA